MEFLSIVKAVSVRLFLLAHSLLLKTTVYMVIKARWVWLLAILDLALVIEGLIIVYKRKGREWKWFCPCFLIYLMSVIPGIWLMELPANTFQPDSVVISMLQENPVLQFLEHKTARKITEQLLPFALVIARWCLPRGSLSRKDISQVLFVYIAIASDIMSIFSLFEEREIKKDMMLICAVLAAWSLSLLQFTYVITATQSPRKARYLEAEELVKGRRCQMESVSLLMSVLVQDGPFFVVRVYAIVVYRLVTYSLLFFSSKNLLMILLVFYRIVVVQCNYEDDEEEKDDDSPDGAVSKKESEIRHDIYSKSKPSRITPKRHHHHHGASRPSKKEPGAVSKKESEIRHDIYSKSKPSQITPKHHHHGASQPLKKEPK